MFFVYAEGTHKAYRIYTENYIEFLEHKQQRKLAHMVFVIEHFRAEHKKPSISRAFPFMKQRLQRYYRSTTSM